MKIRRLMHNDCKVLCIREEKSSYYLVTISYLLTIINYLCYFNYIVNILVKFH